MERLFNLDAQLLFDACVMALSMLVMFTFLSYLLFKPVRKLLEDRKQRVADEQESAKNDRKEAAVYKEEYEQKLKEIDKEAQAILSEARKKAMKTENEIVAEVIKGFAALMISDDEFINQFSAYSKSSKKKVLRYILIKLNDSYSREIKTNMQPEQVNIEHIMPKKMQKWGDSHISEADHEKYLWRLGNLTLLGDDYNKKASNNVFAEKRAEYGKSDIALTKEVCDYDTWSIETILQRQKQMAKLAVKVWPILNA